ERFDRLDASFQRARVDRGELHRREPVDESGRLGPAAVIQVDPGGSAVEDPTGLGGHGVPDQEEGRHRPSAYGPTVRATPATGSRTSKVEPAASSLVTRTSPPWFSATCLTIASPSPVPPVSRDRARSTR